MTITIAGIPFDDHEYDDRGDVLYLSVGPPREAAESYSTPEGHVVHYDSGGAIIGLTLMAVRYTLERDGELTLTWPQAHLQEKELDPALVAAA